MFNIGDYIIYGSNGVCRVDEIGNVIFTGAPKDKLYYTLTPVFAKGSKIYCPVDNTKLVMRPILSHEEAQALVEDVIHIGELWESDAKKREEIYKNVIHNCDSRELVRMIKTLYFHRQERAAQGKKAMNADEKYFHMAEDNLYGELSISLGIAKDKVKEYIEKKVQNT